MLDDVRAADSESVLTADSLTGSCWIPIFPFMMSLLLKIFSVHTGSRSYLCRINRMWGMHYSQGGPSYELLIHCVIEFPGEKKKQKKTWGANFWRDIEVCVRVWRGWSANNSSACECNVSSSSAAVALCCGRGQRYLLHYACQVISWRTDCSGVITKLLPDHILKLRSSVKYSMCFCFPPPTSWRPCILFIQHSRTDPPSNWTSCCN